MRGGGYNILGYYAQKIFSKKEFSMKKMTLSLFMVLCMLFLSILTACQGATEPEAVTEAVSDETSSTTTAEKNDDTPNTPDEQNQPSPEEPNEPNTPNAPNTPEQPNEPAEPSYPRPSELRTYELNEETAGIKVLGERHLKVDGCITMDWTGAGIEFNADLNTKSNVSFVAKSNALCYFKAYVNGLLWKNGTSSYFTVGTNDTVVELKDVPAGTHTIRLIKVTGYTIAQASVSSVTLDGTISETAPAKNELYIEYLGDSISCGWGVIGNHTGNWADQDGTLAYPYLVSQRLGADYSITALSGKGMVVGNPNFKDNYLHASPMRTTEAEYDFARQADIVVINLGTNDVGQHANMATYREAYAALLGQIFEKHGEDCVVYCLWGAMGDGFSYHVNTAISTYKQSNPNAKIYTLQLAGSSVPGGAPSWGHPSKEDNMKYTIALEALITETYLSKN